MISMAVVKTTYFFHWRESKEKHKFWTSTTGVNNRHALCEGGCHWDEMSVSMHNRFACKTAFAEAKGWSQASKCARTLEMTLNLICFEFRKIICVNSLLLEQGQREYSTFLCKRQDCGANDMLMYCLVGGRGWRKIAQLDIGWCI